MNEQAEDEVVAFLTSALVLVVLPALAAGALGAYIGVLLAPGSLDSGGVGAFFGALFGAALALFAWFLCGAWHRPPTPAWITGFAVIGIAMGVVLALPLEVIAVVSSATLFVIIGVVVLLEGVVVLHETDHGGDAAPVRRSGSGVIPEHWPSRATTSSSGMP